MLEVKERALCPKCGRTLARSAPQGLCSKCLLGAALEEGPLTFSVIQERNVFPRTFGAYELLAEEARGGMGIVYRARQSRPNRVVALKVLAAGQFAAPNFVERFRVEAEAVASLNHPNIVPIYEVGEWEGQPFFSMRLIEGGSLAKRIADGIGRGSLESVTKFVAKLARAVHFAHQRGILHRDIKPGNVLLDGEGEPHLTDFGLAKLVEKESSLTRTMAMLGTPSYMSPEQAQGEGKELTTAVDVYGLGAVLYELLTGQPPFSGGTTFETIRKVIDTEPRRPSSICQHIDRDLETICLRCLEKKPTKRYGSAEAVAEDLERWLRKEPIQARPSTPVDRFGKWMQRNPRVAFLALLLQLVLAAGLAGIATLSFRLVSANRDKEGVNRQLVGIIRNFEWQKVEELVETGKRGDALAFLSDFLRRNPHDAVAATRIVSMLDRVSFPLPAMLPLRHGAAVESVSVSEDGRTVATAAADNNARIWNLETGELITIMPHGSKVNYVTYVAKDRYLLTRCHDGSSKLWDVTAKSEVLDFRTGINARFPPKLDADRTVVALTETIDTVQVWDLERRERSGGLLRTPGRVTQAAFGRDTNVIAVGSHDGQVLVWKVGEPRPITALKHLQYDVTGLDFSPDGKLLAVAVGFTVTLWETQSWSKNGEFDVSDTQTLSIAFTPDGKHLISTAYDRPIKIWDVVSRKLVGQPVEGGRPFCYFRISSDGTRLASFSQGGIVRMWDATSGLPLSDAFEHEGPVTDLIFSPDGKTIVTSSQDGTVQVLKVQAIASPKVFFQTRNRYPSACFSLDGTRVLGSTEGKVLMFDRSGEPRGKPMPHADPIFRMKLSPDGQNLVTVTWDGTARIWDMKTCEAHTPVLNHSGRLLDVAYSPDGRWVATASEDSTSRIWDANTGQPVSPLLASGGDVLGISFHPNSRMLLTCGVDGTARLWSSPEGEPIWAEPIRHKGIIWTAQFNPAGDRIVTASSDKSAMIWDAQSGRPLTQAMRHEQAVKGARFSPDGKSVLTCSDDGTARLWNSSNGEAISQPMRHKAKIKVAEFSPDGTRVLTGSRDGVARLWDSATGYPVSEALQHGDAISCLQFSPDGRHFLSAADVDALRVWEVPQPPVPVPAWFCDFVEAVGGMRMDSRRNSAHCGRDSLQAFRQRFAKESGNDFYTRWAHSFLSERTNNSAGPVRR